MVSSRVILLILLLLFSDSYEFIGFLLLSSEWLAHIFNFAYTIYRVTIQRSRPARARGLKPDDDGRDRVDTAGRALHGRVD